MFPQVRTFSKYGKLPKVNYPLPKSILQIEKFTKSPIQNEPTLKYKAGSLELANLQKAIEFIESKCEEIPIVINGKELKSNMECFQVVPHNHTKAIAKFHYADKTLIMSAINAAVDAQKKWDTTDLGHRIQIWERAADLMSTKYRADLVASTMVGQSKTVVQAEIDAAAELIDFTRMNAQYLKAAAQYQPISENPSVTRNFLRFRGIDGFVAAISPFNFTAIGGNLAYTPALMGNAVLWKPAETAMLSSYRIFNIMREAGVPDGVVNFVPAYGPTFGNTITSSSYLAGINFTGSMQTFKTLWKLVGQNIDHYRNFPRMLGECGGKNFHFVHNSADVSTVVATTIRSAFEYGGQKCSACSRLYVPVSLWESKIIKPLVEKTCQLTVGDVSDLTNFFGAVIDEKSYKRILRYIDYAKSCNNCKVLAGGQCMNLKGYFIDPTIVLVNNPEDRLLKEEIFGPVLAVYVYKDSALETTMDLAASTTKYGLTGAVFGTDEAFLRVALQKFKNTAGNFYINDKSTGAVVGQQPFGGGRMSGTNDKAGGPHYIIRWTSPQTIKETYVPMVDITYPYMGVNIS